MTWLRVPAWCLQTRFALRNQIEHVCIRQRTMNEMGEERLRE
jgi:hypothetical protein